VKTLPPDEPDNALILGTAFHTGIQRGIKAAVAEYYGAYPIITDAHVNEAIKLENVITRARNVIPDNGIFEIQISQPGFIGFADYLVPVGNDEYDLYDFKYASDADRYRESGQLHVYRYHLEPKYKIRNMFFLVAPKVNIKQKKTEDLFQFRKRIMSELKESKGTIIPIEYDYQKVIEFKNGIKEAEEATCFTKNTTILCNWCEYQEHCKEGTDYMILPENKRRQIEGAEKLRIWLYGAPYSGKTTFANSFPDPLILNTDGNVSFVDAPVLPIRDVIKMDGRLEHKTFAWDVFKDAISELEKKQNTFKTVIVDLIEDMYEHCRIFMYSKMNIDHESDAGYGKGYDRIKTEFLVTLKRLMNLDYETIILISHEDTSKDVTRKNGDKITAIKPNLRDVVATKIAGMVDITARIIADGNVHTLSFKTSDVIFGGGRLKVSTNEIPLEYAAFRKICEETKPAQPNTAKRSVQTPPPEPPQATPEAIAAPSERKPVATRGTDEITPSAQSESKPVVTRRGRSE
jgi:hypothetical protein